MNIKESLLLCENFIFDKIIQLIVNLIDLHENLFQVHICIVLFNFRKFMYNFLLNISKLLCNSFHNRLDILLQLFVTFLQTFNLHGRVFQGKFFDNIEILLNSCKLFLQEQYLSPHELYFFTFVIFVSFVLEFVSLFLTLGQILKLFNFGLVLLYFLV